MLTKILVTGGNGYVGSNIIKTLSPKLFDVSTIIRKGSDASCLNGTKVKIYHGNFNDRALLNDALAGVDVVIHTAGIVDPSNQQQEQMMEINYRATKLLINQSINMKVKKFIYISSSSVLPLCQDNLIDGKYVEASNFNLNKASDYYTKSKALATNYVLFCANKGYIDASVIYPTSIIGPNYTKMTLIHQMIEMYLNKKLKITLNGGYNFVDIRTVAEATINAIQHSKSGEGYIVGGEYVTIDDVLKKLANLTNRKPNKIKIPNIIAHSGVKIVNLFTKNNHNPLFSTSALKTIFDCSDFSSKKALDELNIHPIPFDTSLLDTINYMHPKQPGEQLSML